MTLLILGLILWIGAHMMKRLAPEARRSLTARWGENAKIPLALVLVLSLVLIVLGYQHAPYVTVYSRTPAMVGINNLLMIFAVGLFSLGGAKSRLTGKIRHPMLTGVVVWSVAHLLVNGDTSSFILFGTMGLWAIAEMVIINRQEPAPEPFTAGTLKGDIRLVIGTVLGYAIIAGIHTWLGYYPFGG